MLRNLLVLLATSAMAMAQNGGAPSHVCVYDGLKYKTLLSAMTDCGKNGFAVIPPSYAGPDPANAKNPQVWDFRHPESVKGLIPVTDFGVKGDAATGTDGVSRAGSQEFTTGSSSPFVRGRDESKAIVITGAGPENASLTTTIRTVEAPNRVTLAIQAGFTGNNLKYWFGTENTPAFQKASASRKALFLPPGMYLMTGTVKGSFPLFLMGSGDQSTIIDDNSVFDVHGTEGHFLNSFRMQPATKVVALAPRSFPTPNPGTPVAVDRHHSGQGYQPTTGDGDIWTKLSKQQQSQQIGPTLSLSSDGIHIYHITGDTISIILFDTQFSEVAQCDFRAGKNFVGGIALWHTPNDGQSNRTDSIHDNTVRDASYSGIVWAASDGITIRDNIAEYNGESGLKNYSSQRDGSFNTHVEVSGNRSQYNHYDGLDFSETYPHSNQKVASSIASKNTSSFNDRTGAFVDGRDWKLLNNIFESNGLTGMSLDVSDSVISGNTLSHNNSLHDSTAHQMLIGPARPSLNNVIEHNRITGDAASGAAIKWGGSSTGNQLRDNTATGGSVFRLDTPPADSQRNSDSRGDYPHR